MALFLEVCSPVEFRHVQDLISALYVILAHLSYSPYNFLPSQKQQK